MRYYVTKETDTSYIIILHLNPPQSQTFVLFLSMWKDHQFQEKAKNREAENRDKYVENTGLTMRYNMESLKNILHLKMFALTAFFFFALI